ncbi:MAG: carboxypeptidase regulatory-like domain-containing protein [Phycisphaeraceae bacterium]
MTPTRFCTIMFAAALIVAGVSPSNTAANAAVEKAAPALQGQVVDEQGQPVPQATIVVLGARIQVGASWQIDKIAQVTTDAQGRFQIEASPALNTDRLLVAARHQGHAIGSWNGARHEVPESLTLRLGTPERIGGTVVDEAGKPIAGASLRALVSWQADGQTSHVLGHEAIPELLVKSDEQGRFTLTAVPRGGMAALIVSAPGRAGTNWPADGPTIAAGTTNLSIPLPPEATVRGIVRCEDASQSLKGPTIAAVGGGLSFLNDWQATTDAQGRFSLGGLPAGAVRLVAILPQNADNPWMSEEASVTLATGQTLDDVAIQLRRAGTLEVTAISQAEQKPVAGAQVLVHPLGGGRSWQEQTDKDGVARFQLLPGNYMYFAAHPDYATVRRRDTAQVSAGQKQQVQWALAAATMLQGVVTDRDGKPVAGMQVLVLPGFGDHQPVTTDEAGRFKTRWTPPDWGQEVTSLAVAIDRKGNQAVAIDVDDPSKPLALKLEPACTVTGRVTDEQGQPLVGASVTVLIHRGNWGSDLANLQAHIDADGQFRLTALPAQVDYTLTATAPGYGQHRWRIEAATAGEPITAPQVKLPKADQELTGTVVDTAGKPVARAVVYVYGDTQPQQQAQSDAQGKFTLRGLCAGYVEVTAQAGGPPQLWGQNYAKVGGVPMKIVVSAQGSSSEPAEEPQPQPLTGQMLPDLAGLGLTAKASATHGPLIVFIDARQRPCRHAIQALHTQRAGADDAQIMVVQLGAADDALLARLDIKWPLARISENVDQVRLTWGVPALPWYILADSTGKVTHAGTAPPVAPDQR